jgi:FkbM family methyltransferase
MMSAYYSTLGHAKLAARGQALKPFRRSLRRVPLLRSLLPGAKRWVNNVLLPNKREWVKVQSGLARGVWLRLDLNAEGEYWIGTYEARVQSLLKSLCAPRSIFYDIGASLGFFSFAVASRIGPNAKVFSFEPEPENGLRFREIAVRNNLQDRLELVEAAVWSYTCSAGIPFKRGGLQRTYGGVLADGVAPVLAEGETRPVSTISLDDFIRGGHPAPDVLKIDVEGGECEVLKGGEELFSRAKPALICEVHREEAAQWIADWLAGKDYVAVWWVPDELFPRLLFGRPARPHG